MGLNYQAAIEISAAYTGQSAVAKATVDIKGLGDASEHLKEQLGDLVKDGLKGLAAAFTIEKVFEFSKQVLELGEKLEILSQKTGIGVQALSYLKTAAELNNLAFEDFQVPLKKFGVSLAEAGSGAQKSKQVFEALGISIRGANGQLRPTGNVLEDVAKKFSTMDNGATKSALAVRLFGRSGVDLIPTLNELGSSSEHFGIVISEEFATRSKIFNDELKLMGVNSQQLGVDILAGILPALDHVGEALVEFGKRTDHEVTGIGVLAEIIRQLGAIVIAAGESIGLAFDLAVLAVKEIIEVTKLAAKELINLGYVGQAAARAITGDFEGAKESISEFGKGYTDGFKNFFAESGKNGDKFVDRQKSRLEEYKKLIFEINKGGLLGSAETAPEKRKTTQAAALPDDKTLETEKNKVAALRDEVEKLEGSYALEAKAVTLTSFEYEKQKIEIDEAFKLKKELLQFKDEDQKQALREVTEEIILQKEALVDLKQQQEESFGHGAQEAVKQYAETVGNVAAQSKKLFTDAFNGIEDTFVKFVQTGKLSFADLAKAIEGDLIRIAYRALIVKPLLSAFGVSSFANGGIMTSEGSMPLKRYAGGGVANTPQLALFGEGRQPEAFVPLPDGRSIPVTMRGQGGASSGGDTNVSVSVTIQNGQTTQDSKSQEQSGKSIGNMIASAVKSTIIQEQRPGGLLAAR